MIRKNNLPTSESKIKRTIAERGDLRRLAKQNLKTMQKNRSKHPIREKTRVAKYGATSFARNIWLTTAAILVMIITLVILFVTVVASIILNNTAIAMREKIDITVYIKPGTSQEILQELADEMQQDSNVKSVEYRTSEEELDEFIEENKNDEKIIAGLKNETVYQKTLSEMKGTIHIKVYDTDNLDSIKNLVETSALYNKYIDDEYEPTYDANQAEISTITSWANIAKNGGIVLGAVFLTISVLVIFNTVRMSIFSRREEIYMMKLIGANKSFIRGPFVVEAEMCGLISGVIAASLCYAGFVILAPKLSGWGIDVSSIQTVLESNQLVLVYLAFILVGMLIGFGSARLAVSKYLHKA